MRFNKFTLLWLFGAAIVCALVVIGIGFLRNNPFPQEGDRSMNTSSLAPSPSANVSSEEDIRKQLETLKLPKDAKQPSQEEILKQLETLKKK